MNQYEQALEFILKNGSQKTDRTGTGSISYFGHQIRFNLKHGFPAVTTKKLMWQAVKSELLWFLEGSNDERRLAEILHGTRDPSKKTVWTDNANAPYWKNKAEFEGHLGRVYGVQWRSWLGADGKTYDQIAQAIFDIKKNPDSRRIIVNAWKVDELDQMALPPCHVFFQFYVNDNKLSCHLYQRSADFFLGVPFNIASYALLTHMVAQVCNLEVGDFVHSFGDAHIYNNHIEQVNLQLSRTPYQYPTLKLNPNIKNIFDFKMEDIELDNYQHHPAISAIMAV